MHPQLTIGHPAYNKAPSKGSPAILFILKFREGYWGGYDNSSGLLNSVTFIVQMLVSLGIRAEAVQVVDNNAIEAAIKAFKPTTVIIEAYWVVPEKFDVLQKQFPHIHFAVRNHSDIPFLANEGISMQWTIGYLKRGIEIMCNAPRAVSDMQAIALSLGGYEALVSYAPNYYPISAPPNLHPRAMARADDAIKIGCFGSIRPLKDQLLQCIAAIRFAQFLGKKLEFHINGSRVEGQAAPILKNLQQLMDGMPRGKLVQHPWLNHVEFLELIGSMDYSMQCSMSETFNIVSADAVAMDVIVVGSREIPWLGSYGWADPTNSVSMLQNLIAAHSQRNHGHNNNRYIWQWRDLWNYSQKSKAWWQGRFG